MQRADQLRRSSVDPTEKLVQTFNQMLKKQEKEIATVSGEGQILVDEMQNIMCRTLQIRGYKANKVETRLKKSDGIFKKFFGVGSSNQNNAKQQTSLSQEESILQ